MCFLSPGSMMFSIYQMLVKRKKSAKRGRKLYEALEFAFSSPSYELVTEFVGDLGTVFIWKEGRLGIILKDGNRITPDQLLLKDGRGRLLCFDMTIFYDWYEIWKE